jgi:hypothetical protein
MGVLGPVVAPSASLMSFCNSEIFDCGSIIFEIVRDELVRHKRISLQKLAHKFQRRPFVPPTLDQNVKHFTLGVDGAPQVGHAAIDFKIKVEWPGGIAPPGSHRSGRERLPSSGSYCSTVARYSSVQCAKSAGSRRLMSWIQYRARRRCPLRRRYFDIAQHARRRSRWKKRSGIRSQSFSGSRPGAGTSCTPLRGFRSPL